MLLKLKYVVVFLLVQLNSPKIVFAQSNSSTELSHYLAQSETLLKDGGKWFAKNEKYDPKEEWSPNYFGYEFTKGINSSTFSLKITGYFPKQSQWLIFWDGKYAWDYKNRKVVYQSINSDGALAMGESETIKKDELVLVFTITFPDGKIERHRDVQKITESQIQSASFIESENKWKPNSSMVWDRLSEPKGNLLFMSTRDGNFEVYSMDAKGENLKNLTCNKATDYAFSNFKDGRLLFYSNRDGNDEIYIMESDGKRQQNITNHPSADRIPNLSPDATKILFISDRDHKNGEIYVMDVDGKNLKRLTNNEYFEDAANWSVDGNKIIFTRELKDLKSTGEKAVGNGEVFIMNADGSNQLQLTQRLGFDGGSQFSPDGNKIAFYGKNESGNSEIFIMNADGKDVVNLTEDPLEDYSPSWSHDGKWIAYTKGDSKNYDVWLIHLETKIKTRLTTQPKRDESPVWLTVN